MLDEILARRLDAQVTAVKRDFAQKMAEIEPGSAEAWAALFERKLKGKFAGSARKTEFSLRYGMAKNIINEIR